MEIIREAVLLAAGYGERFRRETGEHKLFKNVDELPLICYPVRSLLHTGIKRIIVVVNNKNVKEVRETLSEHAKEFCVEIAYIVNDTPERGNGYSLLLAIPYVKSKYFIVSMSDHVYPPTLVKEIIKQAGCKEIPMLGGDQNPLYIDLSEATRIHVENERIIAIGKNIEPYEYIDVGVYLLTKDLPYGECVAEKLELSKLLQCIANKAFLGVADVSNIPWTDIDTYNDYIELIRGQRRKVLEKVKIEWEMKIENKR